MNILRTLIIAAILSILTGCSGSPIKQTITNNEANTQIEPNPDLVTLVTIRPYNYFYFGHNVEVLVNNISQVSLPNQSYSKLTAKPGKIDIKGQSGLLGPPSKEIQIEGNKADVIYLAWKTITQPNLSTGIPIVLLTWQKITKEEADILLKDVSYTSSKNVSSN
jgi:hypothetical protein